MGQHPSQVRAIEDYSLVQELPIGNIVKHHKTQNLHFLKECSFTAQQAYQNALNMHSLKLANKNEHILNFQHFTTKSENSFCSTFHKIVLIFEYIDYSLEAEMNTRIRDNRPFTEKEMWSVLCSCVLAAVHLIHSEGKMHSGLTVKDIRLTSSGCVKLLSHEMIGIDPSHDLNEGKPKTLVTSLIECFLLERLSNQNKDYLESLIENLDCSRDMKQMLNMMTSQEMKFTELEQHLFKLVQDDESMASNSNTPILKAQSPINSNYKCPRIYRQDYAEEQPKPTRNMKRTEACENDKQDCHQKQLSMELNQNQKQCPDETDSENQNEEVCLTNRESPQKINSFFLRERKTDDNIVKEVNKYEIKKQVQGSKKEYSMPKNEETENIFTDPKLFSLIKNDLEEIKMRKSLADLASYQSSQSSKQNISYPAQTHAQHMPESSHYSSTTSLLDNKIIEQSCSITDLRSIEMIKECSSESREQETEEQFRVNLVEPKKSVENILSNPSIGFKKKSGDTKRDAENVESNYNKKQTTPIRIYEDILASSPFPDKKKERIQANKVFDKNTGKNEQFFHGYSNSRPSNSSRKDELVVVNEKYARGRYEGTKLNGKRHGSGSFYYSEGGKYVGNWSENKMHGKGTLYYPNQKIAYEGHWQNDQLSGQGTLYNEEVTPLRNPFDYRDFSDVEEYWTKYEGNFYQDNKEGKGKLYLVNGERLQATFKDDKVDGEGILYRGDGTFVKGKWRANQLVGLF